MQAWHQHTTVAWPCGRTKNLVTLLDLCVSSLRRGHANLLCIVPSLTDDPRKESSARLLRSTWRRARAATAAARKTERILHDPMYVNICIGGRFVRARSGWPAGRCAPIPFPHPSPPARPIPSPPPPSPPRGRESTGCPSWGDGATKWARGHDFFAAARYASVMGR